MQYTARYQCLKCQHSFSQEQPTASPPSCPMCKHLWVKWLNYESLRDRFGWQW